MLTAAELGVVGVMRLVELPSRAGELASMKWPSTLAVVTRTRREVSGARPPSGAVPVRAPEPSSVLEPVRAFERALRRGCPSSLLRELEANSRSWFSARRVHRGDGC
jgi:hypothetical protein